MRLPRRACSPAALKRKARPHNLKLRLARSSDQRTEAWQAGEVCNPAQQPGRDSTEWSHGSASVRNASAVRAELGIGKASALLGKQRHHHVERRQRATRFRPVRVELLSGFADDSPGREGGRGVSASAR